MKTSPIALLTLVLGLALGFAAGAIFNGDGAVGASPPLVVRGTDIAVDADAPAPAISGDGLVGASRPSLQNSAMPSSAAAVKGTSREAQIAARSAISAHSGDGEDKSTWTNSIAGIVLDPSGEPMAGVTVVGGTQAASAWRGHITGKETEKVGRSWPGFPDANEVLAKRADQLLDAKRNSVTVVSDANGQFTLKGLRDGVHTVSGYMDGFEFKPEPVHSGRDCTLVAQQIFEVELDVRLPDGTQPERAVVIPDAERIGAELAWSPSAPRIRLKHAAIELMVRSGNVQRLDWRSVSADFTSKAHAFNLENGDTGPHVIELTANQILRVTVDDESTLRPRLPVWVKAAASSSDPDAINWSDEEHSVLTASPDGLYQMMDAPKGTYVLAAGRGKGGQADAVQSISVGEGITAASLVLGEVDLDEFVVVHCSRSGGQPIDEVSFGVERGPASYRRPVRVTAVKRSRGEFWISKGEVFEADNEEPASMTATTKVEGKITVSVERDDAEVSIEFEPACSIEMVVHGDLTAGYVVKAEKRTGDNKPSRSYYSPMNRDAMKLQEGGLVTLTGLQPGTYDVTIYRSGHGSAGLSFSMRSNKVLSEEVEVSGEAVTVEVTIPGMHTLNVRATALAAGSKLFLSPKGGNGYSDRIEGTVGADAMVQFDNVFAGEYVLTRQSKRDNVEVSVPCGEVQFTVEVPNALKVQSVEAEGAAAAAGLKKGDIITALNGLPIEGESRGNEVQNAARAAATSLTVQRGSTTLELMIGPLSAAAGGTISLGARLRPHTQK